MTSRLLGQVPSQTSTRWALSVCLLAAFVSVTIRLFMRGVISKDLHFEDACIVAGLSSHIAYTAMSLTAVKYGLGKHTGGLAQEDVIHLFQWYSNADLTYGIAVLFIKLAIPLQFLTIFVPDRRLNHGFWTACWITMLANLIFYIVYIFLQAFFCHPYEEAWIVYLDDERCMLKNRAWMNSTGVFNFALDLVLLLLPIHSILKLQMKRHKKIQVLAIFSLGIMASAAAVARAYYLFYFYVWPVDTSLPACMVVLTSQIEVTCGILVFCLPVFPHFLRLLKDRLRTLRAQALWSARNTASSPEIVERND